MAMVYIPTYLGFQQNLSIELYGFLHRYFAYSFSDLFRGTGYFDATFINFFFLISKSYWQELTC